MRRRVSSGSGNKPAAKHRITHSAATLFYAYKPFTHQHVPEVEQELHHVGDWNSETGVHDTLVAGIAWDLRIDFMSSLTGEMSRKPKFRGLFGRFL